MIQLFRHVPQQTLVQGLATDGDAAHEHLSQLFIARADIRREMKGQLTFIREFHIVAVLNTVAREHVDHIERRCISGMTLINLHRGFLCRIGGDHAGRSKHAHNQQRHKEQTEQVPAGTPRPQASGAGNSSIFNSHFPSHPFLTCSYMGISRRISYAYAHNPTFVYSVIVYHRITDFASCSFGQKQLRLRQSYSSHGGSAIFSSYASVLYEISFKKSI